MDEIEMRLESAVGGGKLARELDLEEIAKDIEAEEVKYDLSHYHGIILRFEPSGPAVLIYKSGSFSISGAKTIDELRETFDRFHDQLGVLLGEPEYELEFAIRNLVHTTQFRDEGGRPRPIDLNAVAIGLGMESTEYEPEQFPGVMFRPDDDPGLYLIFGSGKIVSTGHSSEKAAEAGVARLMRELEKILPPL